MREKHASGGEGPAARDTGRDDGVKPRAIVKGQTTHVSRKSSGFKGGMTGQQDGIELGVQEAEDDPQAVT